jgi:hypothetical protein
VALLLVRVVPALVVRVVCQDQWLPAPTQPVLVDGEGEAEQVVLVGPVPPVASVPVARWFARRSGGAENLD